MEKTERQARYHRGRRAEWFAALFMMARGYRILNIRYKTPLGELDIVAKRGRRIAFIEVKRRNTLDEAILSITPTLQQRVSRAAEIWLKRKALQHTGDIGFDVVALIPRQWPHYLKDAFDHR